MTSANGATVNLGLRERWFLEHDWQECSLECRGDRVWISAPGPAPTNGGDAVEGHGGERANALVEVQGAGTLYSRVALAIQKLEARRLCLGVRARAEVQRDLPASPLVLSRTTNVVEEGRPRALIGQVEVSSTPPHVAVRVDGALVAGFDTGYLHRDLRLAFAALDANLHPYTPDVGTFTVLGAAPDDLPHSATLALEDWDVDGKLIKVGLDAPALAPPGPTEPTWYARLQVRGADWTAMSKLADWSIDSDTEFVALWFATKCARWIRDRLPPQTRYVSRVWCGTGHRCDGKLPSGHPYSAFVHVELDLPRPRGDGWRTRVVIDGTRLEFDGRTPILSLIRAQRAAESLVTLVGSRT